MSSKSRREKHFFTDAFPAHDYACTTESRHPQTPLWPSYLSVDPHRVCIFERSKNAQLVVYTANFRPKGSRTLDPKKPLDINWQSFGWTASPTTNAVGMIERRLAWGYAHKAVAAEEASPAAAVGTSYTVTLNALPSRSALLYVDAKDRVVLQVAINGVASRLWKIYVKTSDTQTFVPAVLYVDLYGTNVDDDAATYERIWLSEVN